MVIAGPALPATAARSYTTTPKFSILANPRAIDFMRITDISISCPLAIRTFAFGSPWDGSSLKVRARFRLTTVAFAPVSSRNVAVWVSFSTTDTRNLPLATRIGTDVTREDGWTAEGAAGTGDWRICAGLVLPLQISP